MAVEALGQHNLLVEGIGQVVSQPDDRSVELFACSDRLRKGAALNAIQILELLKQ